MNTPSKPRTLKRFFSHAAIYGLGDLLTKFARYILIPIYIAVMTRAEIGQLAVLQATTMICWAVSCLGLGASVRRFYLSQTDSDESQANESHPQEMDEATTQERDSWVAGLWWTRLGVALVPMAIIFALVWQYSEFLFPSIPVWMVLIACSTGYFRSSSDIVEAWFAIREEPMQYRTLTFCQFLLTTALILTFVLGFSMGVLGVILGECIAVVIWTLTTGFIITRNQWPSFSNLGIKRVFRYSSPWVPHAVCMWLLVSGDRIVLQQFVSHDQIGLYDVAYLFGSVLMVIASGLRAAWLPDYFRTANAPGGQERYESLTRFYMLAVFGGAFATICFCSEAITLFGGANYAGSVLPCKIVTLGITCFACFIAFNQPLLLKRQTLLLAGWSLCGIIVNLTTNLLLIPKYGINAAAGATVAAYAVMMFGVLITCKIKFATPAPILSLLMGFGILTLMLWLTHSIENGTWQVVCVKATLLAMFVGSLALSNRKFINARRQPALTK